MTIINSGTLTPSRDFTDEEIAFLNNIFGTDFHNHVSIYRNEISFDETYGDYWEPEINEAVDYLAQRSATLEGRIYYSGAYEGAYIVRPGEHVEEYDRDQLAIIDATDETLISELKKRGYQVIKDQLS